ncbi:MAG: AAA family ATPase, partial [Candidatus Beckwithbacteria bacterium]|nr:AAA family ATPase [Candidatus Beckwithbacteria bacterium]
MKLYKRKILARIQKLIGKEKGLVLQGARRVGKTAILQYLQDGLNRQGKRTVYYDLAYPDVLANLSRGAPALTADLTSKGYANEEVYVLIDDLQQLKQRDLFLGSILELNKNIHLIAASAVRVKPPPPLKVLEVSALSFSEFLEFKALESAQ